MHQIFKAVIGKETFSSLCIMATIYWLLYHKIYSNGFSSDALSPDGLSAVSLSPHAHR